MEHDEETDGEVSEKSGEEEGDGLMERAQEEEKEEELFCWMQYQ